MIKDFNKIAIITEEREVSYSEMLQRITLFSRLSPQATGAPLFAIPADGMSAAAKCQLASDIATKRAKTIILSENREGWVYAFFSVWLNQGIAIPVDALSTPQDIAYIIQDSLPNAIWTSHKCESAAREAIRLAGKDVQILLIEEHEQAPIPADTPKAEIPYEQEQTALIIYTSGTTGSPKGVMLSFKNLLINSSAVSEKVPIITEPRRSLVLLPLHHVLPLQGALICPILIGAGIAIAPSLTAQAIMSTMQRGHIGLFIGVPRLWQTLYTGIKKKIDANFVSRLLFRICKAIGNPKLSRIIFKKVHTTMGGKLEACVSGGAALDPEVWYGLRALGIDIYDGYGMTECAPMISFSRPGDLRSGCVGLPMPSTEVRIIDNEICTRGDHVMQGYYNRPDETADVFDAEGWLHTGDLGKMDAEQHLFITGRKKEIIVLSNGKNINPVEIEFQLEKHTEIVKETGIVQDHDMLKAIIVPQESWAAGKSIEEQETELKRLVLEPYNQSVPPYRRLLSLFVYHGELPRTRMDKLQRFKLPAILLGGKRTEEKIVHIVEPSFPEYQIIKQYIREEKKVSPKPTDNIETDLAFDSLDRVGMQGFIEQTFGMELSAERIGAFRNITEMAEYVADFKTRVEVEKTDWHTLLQEPSNNLELPRMLFTGHLIVWFCRLFFKFYFSLRSKGVENIPQTGSFILACNHQSYIDGMLAVVALSKQQVANISFFAKEQHVESPFARYMAARHNVIVLKHSDLKNSICRVGEVLKMGKNLIIFPEGTRTETGELGEFKKMFTILSQELRIPIVPVCIQGAFEAMPKHKKIPRRKPITVTYLPVVRPEDAVSYDELAELVKSKIAEAMQ